MGFVANPYALPGLVAAALAWLMAILIYAAGGGQKRTRILALLLFLEGAGALGGFGGMWTTDDPASAYAWQMIGVATFFLFPAIYPAFLATLDSPLAKPLRNRWVVRGFIAVSVGAAAWALMNPQLFAIGVVPVWWAPYEVVPGPYWNVLFAAAGVLMLYGLAIAISAHRRAKPGEERARTRAYLIAFGVRDAVWGVLYFLAPFWFQKLGIVSDLFVIAVLPLATTAYVLLLAYGVLRVHLFDIDVRLRWTIRASTLAAIFLGVFFVVAQIAQDYLSTTFGYLLGGAAAGVMLFALHPIQRLAEGVARSAIPDRRTTPAYLAFRKLDVYKAAVESAVESGGIDQKERDILRRLRAKLELAEEDAIAIEADVAQGSSAASRVAAS